MRSPDRPGLVAARALAGMAVIWAALVPAAPRLGDTGGWPAGLATIAYVSGAIVCHQKAERSFASAGRPWPVCARCTGVYVAAGAGIVLMAVPIGLGPRLGRLSHGMWRAAFAMGLLTVALTWLAERLGLVAMSNSARALSGVPLGAAVAAALSLTARARPARPTGPRTGRESKVN